MQIIINPLYNFSYKKEKDRLTMKRKERGENRQKEGAGVD